MQSLNDADCESTFWSSVEGRGSRGTCRGFHKNIIMIKINFTLYRQDSRNLSDFLHPTAK